MIRQAFTMRLKPDVLADYKRHHDNIWPELVAEIERSGIASITTFQRGLELFLVSEIADEAAWSRLWSTEVHKRWAQVMDSLMHLREDGIVDAGELTEIFHLTTTGNSQAPPGDSTLVEQVSVDIAIEAEAAAEPLPAPGNSNGSPRPAPGAPDEAPGAPAETAPAPIAEPAGSKPARRARKSAVKKSPGKKKAPGRKKAKRQAARRPKIRVAARRGKKSVRKKPAKKAARKKTAPQKAPKAAQRAKKKATRKHR